MSGQAIHVAGALSVGAWPVSDGSAAAAAPVTGPAPAILAGLGPSRLLDELVQPLLPAIYPPLKARFARALGRVGPIAVVLPVVASILRPPVGLATDRGARPSRSRAAR